MSFPSHPPYPPQQRPPMLTFRTFHERHFSQYQKQLFFSTVPHVWHPAFGPTFQQAEQAHVQEEQGVDEDTCEAAEDHEADDADEEEGTFQLSKEAIEIFEFSRRFREEKERAAQMEKASIKRRRIKRRKLTKLGFALDEGDSGAEESDDADRNGGVDGNEDDGEDDDNDVDEELDFEASRMELPATDVSFLSQGSRRSKSVWRQLYGQESAADTQNTSSTEGTRTIEMLEELLNQSYVDSLGLQLCTTTTSQERGSNPEAAKPGCVLARNALALLVKGPAGHVISASKASLLVRISNHLSFHSHHSIDADSVMQPSPPAVMSTTTKDRGPVPLDPFGNEVCWLFLKHGKCRYKKKCKKSHILPDKNAPLMQQVTPTVTEQPPIVNAGPKIAFEFKKAPSKKPNRFSGTPDQQTAEPAPAQSASYQGTAYRGENVESHKTAAINTVASTTTTPVDPERGPSGKEAAKFVRYTSGGSLAKQTAKYVTCSTGESSAKQTAKQTAKRATAQTFTQGAT
ncbi:hypothetical protein B0O80DRAFT_423896 [Mortierella sp. GBAus27b]|nr:hypothetical protein B0O80DRAFT_423896 [Mortierella sp. GBAus27b]